MLFAFKSVSERNIFTLVNHVIVKRKKEKNKDAANGNHEQSQLMVVFVGQNTIYYKILDKMKEKQKVRVFSLFLFNRGRREKLARR